MVRGILTSLALAAMISMAIAQQGTSEDQAACAGDAFTYCSANLTQGIAAIRACLEHNRHQISHACAIRLAMHRKD